MAGFRVSIGSTLVTLQVASSACLSDITWSDLPDRPPGAGAGGASSSGSRPGVTSPPRSSSGGAASSGASSGASSRAGSGAAAAPPVAALDGGVPDGGEPAAVCGGSTACLWASPFPPASPCAGVRYSVPLVVSGGRPPLSWSLGKESSSEFVLRKTLENGEPLVRLESRSAEGPALGGTVRVRVSDSSAPPQSIELALDLSLRKSCWFAYLSAGGDAGLAGGGRSELHLRDVFLEHDVVVGASAGGPALDFRFSPSGDWLAFRKDTPAGARLYVSSALAPRAAEAREIPIACASSGADAGGAAATDAGAGAGASCGVLDYAWSPDGDQLAFVVSGPSAAQDSLSGVSGFETQGGPGQPWPARNSALWVNEEVPLDYREQLGWLGSDRLVFLGDERSSDSSSLTLALYTAEVGPDGLSPIEGVPPVLGGPGATLRSAAGGAVLIESSADSESSVVTYYAAGEPAMYHSGWLSPSGAYVGWATENAELELYDVRDDESPVASSGDARVAANGACEAVVAWSDPIGGTGRERIACAAGGALEFFEYQRGAGLVHLARVGADLASGARRAFSPDGRWFVFGDTGRAFDLIDLNAASPRRDPSPVQPLSGPVELLYPPTRPGLVNLADVAGLAEYPLPGASSWPSAFTSAGSSPRSSCVEAFWLAPSEWCGAPRAARHLAYAPDSKSLLFENAPGRLSLAHPGVEPSELTVTDALASCAGPCPAPLYAFQP